MASLRDPRQGPQDPTLGTPARRAGSVRRTTAIDSIRPDGVDGPLHQSGRGRDVATSGDGTTTVVADASTLLIIDYGSGATVRTVDVAPAVAGVDAFVGARAGGGFRKMLDLQTGAERGSLPYLLLDDVPGATLVSGMAAVVKHGEDTPADPASDDPTGDEQGAPPPKAPPRGAPRGEMADICAGWQTGGTLLNNMIAGRPTVLLGADAPEIRDEADPLGWVPLPPLPAVATRRIRRLDVWPDGDVLRVDAFFRDSYSDRDAHETAVHEYTVDAAIDADTMVILECSARPRVLPWMECPQAIGSAGRLVGWKVGDLRPEVRAQLVGTTTCTHLNDVLRGLDDVGWLFGLLPSRARAE